VTTVSGIKSLNINDLMINGVAIRPALPADDTLSVTQSVTSKAEASAIATAAAINASTAKTGVTAVPVPVKINGNVTAIGLPDALTLAATADSTVSLYINGRNIPVVMSTTQTEADRRAAVVAAVHANAGLTAVDAVDNGNGGVTLTALDGRNVSIWFDSSKVNAGSFGLGEGTVTHTPEGVTAVVGGNINTTSAATFYASVALQSAKAIKIESGPNGVGEVSLGVQQTPAVAQVSEIQIATPLPTPTITKTDSYIEFSNQGSSALTLNLPVGPDNTLGVFSVSASGVLYRGLGGSTEVIGYKDASLNGTNGAALRFTYLNPANEFYNPVNQHIYALKTASATWTDADAAASASTRLGMNGYLTTVTSQSEQNFIQANAMFGWIGASDEVTEGTWKWVTGPEAGTLFYENSTGLVSSYANWNANEPNNSGGGSGSDYGYLYLNGKWDDGPNVSNSSYVVEYGGPGFGTYTPPAMTNTELESLQSKLTYDSQTTTTDTASVVINGVAITSTGALKNATAMAMALEARVNALINAGTLQNVAVQRFGSTLSVQSTVAGTPFTITGATTNDVSNTISAQTVTDNKTAGTIASTSSNDPSHFAALGFYQGTFGGEVNEANSKMSPPRTGRLAFQVGASEGQRITIDLADFGKGGPITGEITWDADMDPMTPGARIPDPVQGGPSLMGKSLTRTFISSIDAAQDVLKKLDVAMDKVNQTRATMGAVMNRLDHVINNLINVSMNLSGSRSQIEDADYAAASTQLAKTQIMQQASTAILAQANISQQSVLKLLEK